MHKVFLDGAGPRFSSYFNNGLFNLEMKESQGNTTSLKLENTASEAFPAFLDYVYEVAMESAVALHLGCKLPITG